MSVEMKCKIVTFDEVHALVRQLSEQVKASGFCPTTVVGLARGGWVPARLVCDFLGITDLVSLKVEHWLETGRTKDEATIRYPLELDFSEKRILVVDDITDTGKSLIETTRYLGRLHPLEMKTATLQFIPQSQFKPDYYVEEVQDWTWFIYPWNWIEDTTTLIVRLMTTEKDQGWSLNAIEEGLSRLFQIEWDADFLKHVVAIMVERGQVFPVEGAPPTYRIVNERVVTL
jgi:hypoxanthine phosphoribosyltransferase